MDEHFAEVSLEYRNLRTTDEAPILHIREALANPVSLDAVDIGCGAGRYDHLLYRQLRGLRLTCVDANVEMIGELSSFLSAHGHQDFETLVSRIEDLDLAPEAFDCAFSFNAVHHFNFPTFLQKTAVGLRPQGRIFVYTRTPEQNAGSIWGRYFPQFNEKEIRLYTAKQMETWVNEASDLELLHVKNFRYQRSASLDRLLAQARGMHYSTFSLYLADEFGSACDEFSQRVKADFPDHDRLEWHDQNIMLEIGRTSSAHSR